MRNQIFFKHINKFHPINWLAKCVERDRNADLNDIKHKENMLAKSEFLLILADITIRVSNKNIKVVNEIPSNKDFTDFINYYINTTDKQQSKFLREHGILALVSGFLNEQIKFKFHDFNLSGRSHLLYSQYNTTIKEFMGLDIMEIHTIYLILKSIYEDKSRYLFKEEDIISSEHPTLSKKNIKLFLDFFAIDIKKYNSTLKNLGISKDDLYSFRLIEKYPIIKIDNRYIIPTFDNFLYSITSNLYIHLLTHFADIKKAKAYHTELGKEFENYVELLTIQEFSNIDKADDIVKIGDRCEFVMNHKDTSIAVEVKKFAFLRDSIYKLNIDDLNKLLEQHIIKAYKQIENTFQYIDDEKDKIGIIVIFGDISMSSAIEDHLKENFKNDDVIYDERIIIMSIGNYESLLSNRADNVISVLNKYLATEKYQRGDIIQIISSLGLELINPLLEKTYLDSIDKIFMDDNKTLERNSLP
jgi:hypothetical protein